MTPNTKQLLSLHEEVRAAIDLLRQGLHELQSISGANDFYHLPLRLLSEGLERLGKSIFCLHHLQTRGEFPTSRHDFPAGHNGHDIEELLSWIGDNCFDSDYLKRPAAKDDLDFLQNDPLLNRLVHVLSEFGQSARYYHLNVVLGEDDGLVAPEQLWQELEMELLREEEGWETLLTSGSLDRIYEVVNEKFNVPVERLVRALCRLFTLGPLGSEARRVPGLLNPFLTLRDEDLGEIPYSP